MNTNNIYRSIIAFMLFFTPLEVLSQSDTVSNIKTNILTAIQAMNMQPLLRFLLSPIS